MFLPNPLQCVLPIALWLLLGKRYIVMLKNMALKQYIREEGPENHYKKAGTPTMGGLLILATIFVSALVSFIAVGKFPPLYIWLCFLVLGVLGGLGMMDDLAKILKKNNDGISGYTKLYIQAGVGFVLGLIVTVLFGHTTVNCIWFSVPLGWFYPFFTAVVMAGVSNAYNLTDGLDGLAASCGVMTFIALAFVCVQTAPDLGFMCMLAVGGLLGFLCFNRYPALVFMGDTGSLALGGLMAAVCILAQCEVVLLPAGIIYVAETLSVILQVASFKLTGKRIFRMSPLHHHYELGGMSEPMVVFNFSLVQAIGAGVAVLLWLYNLAT